MLRSLLALAVTVSAIGCASPPVADEEQGSTTSHLSACEVLASAAGATAGVTVLAASATGTCATGAVAATVVTGGAAAAGSVVCLAPAAGTALAAVAAVFTAGVTYLVCGAAQSRIESVEGSEVTPAPVSRIDETQCEGRNASNISSETADGCPGEGTTSRLDVVYCFESESGEWVSPEGTRWNCGGKSPHFPCLPTQANGGDATHRHHYTTRYNFSAAKACCFYSEKEDDVTCGAQ